MFYVSSDELGCSVEFDFDSGVCYIKLTEDDSVAETVEENAYIADYDDYGEIAGVEVFLNRSTEAVRLILEELEVEDCVVRFVALAYEFAVGRMERLYNSYSLIDN